MKIEFSNHTGTPVHGVRATFRPSGTNVLSYAVSGLPREVRLERADVNGYGVDLAWSPAAMDVDIALEVKIAGAGLEVEREFWRGADRELPPAATRVRREEAVLLQTRTVWELATREELIATVRKAMASAFPQASRRFFCELDLRSNPVLMPFTGEGDYVVQRRATLIQDVTECLQERVLQRLNWALSHPGTAAQGLRMWEGWSGIEDGRSQIEELSQLQLEIYTHYFGREGGSFDPDGVWQAFTQFANGELQLLEVPERKLWGDWDAGPRGAYLFFFAEFAFMACDAGVHAAAWESLLPPLVAAQRIYMQAYRPNRLALHSLSFTDYEPTNWKPEKMVDDETKLALRERVGSYDPVKLRIEAGRNARDAFPGSSQMDME